MHQFRAVIFDWRGTLVTTLSSQDWVHAALRLLGRDDRPEAVAGVLAAITEAAGQPDRLAAPGVDRDAAVHRATYHGVFTAAGLDVDLADALYAVESDAAYNEFAVDVAPVLRAISTHGLRIAVVSDIHFDVRPAFVAAGIADLISVFVLSYEHGVQKPDPEIFQHALDRLGALPTETLMVGDRYEYDGAALDVGMTTLLLPPLNDVRHERLGLAARLLGVPLGDAPPPPGPE
ncbi:HAD family hydrolase [Micromonospora sp. NPDC048843]|uniref:HAD family hydrolase n=1 Tax=Micromonospora sp. NPDC048843 TaxID=3155389 RepID=UPI0033D8BEB3